VCGCRLNPGSRGLKAIVEAIANQEIVCVVTAKEGLKFTPDKMFEKTHLKESQWRDETAENTPPYSGEVIMVYS
jgi:hypothetical protein